MNVLLTNLSAQQLRHAAELRERIDALQIQLSRVLGGTTRNSVPARSPQKRRLSPAAIANIRAGAKARWAKKSRVSQQPSRKLSSAARARLSAIARERWRKAKAAGRAAL